MDITFLEAATGIRLSKHYADGKFTSYPNVLRFTSHTESVTDIDSLYTVIMDHAARSNCMVKNNLKRAIANERRKGLSDRRTPTEMLVLDFDKFPVSGVSTDLKDVVEYTMSFLEPYGLHDVDYVAQASSSYRMKGNRMSFHVFVLLSEPVDPLIMKTWLKHVNLEIEDLAKHATLSENGHSVTFPLDQSVADNSKLIYIAPPTWKDPSDDPFKGQDAERIIKVTGKGLKTFPLADFVMDTSPGAVSYAINELKNKLRKDKGLPKSRSKVAHKIIGNKQLEVIEKPDLMHLSIVDETNPPHIRCNVGNGDSGAYWFNVFNPEYMHNFKDEPIFSIQEVDPDFYQDILTRYKDYIDREIQKGHKQAADALRPMSFRDVYTDTFFAALYDMATNTFEVMNTIAKTNLEGFYATWGKPEPPFHPDAEVKFEPSSTEPAINVKDMPYKINLWRPSAIMEQEQSWTGDELYVGTGHLIQEKCPTIYKIMHHMLGNGDVEFERMMNWLAFIYQKRVKAETAWVLSGVQGTGKGVFANKILKPLFGERFVPIRTLENMEEQFNDYMRQAIVCVVDEFHMPKSGSAVTKMVNKLKNMITEPFITIRAMRANQVELPSYTSFIFNSNHADAIAIEASDRRYNVSPPQQVPLNKAHPTIDQEIQNLEEELPYFAGALAAFDISQSLVRIPIDNEAKKDMIQAGQSVLEEFANALKTGRLDYFGSILDMEIYGMGNGESLSSAKNIVLKWLKHIDQPVDVKQEEMRTVYNVLTGDNVSNVRFGKMLQRVGVNTHNRKMNAKTALGTEVTWRLDDVTKQNWINDHLKEFERQHLLSPINIGDANES